MPTDGFEADHRSALRRSRLPFTAPLRLHVASGEIALTFDDGPHPAGTPAVLTALEGLAAPATFFLLSTAAVASPTLVADIVESGHALGLHGDVHERLDRQPPLRLLHRLDGSRRQLEDIAGRSVRLFRPPFGRYSAINAWVAGRLGMEVVLWSHDARDWSDPSDPPLEARLRACMRSAAIVLLHDTGEAADRRAEALRRVLPESGLRPVSIPDDTHR